MLHHKLRHIAGHKVLYCGKHYTILHYVARHIVLECATLHHNWRSLHHNWRSLHHNLRCIAPQLTLHCTTIGATLHHNWRYIAPQLTLHCTTIDATLHQVVHHCSAPHIISGPCSTSRMAHNTCLFVNITINTSSVAKLHKSSTRFSSFLTNKSWEKWLTTLL